MAFVRRRRLRLCHRATGLPKKQRAKLMASGKGGGIGRGHRLGQGTRYATVYLCCPQPPIVGLAPQLALQEPSFRGQGDGSGNPAAIRGKRASQQFLAAPGRRRPFTPASWNRPGKQFEELSRELPSREPTITVISNCEPPCPSPGQASPACSHGRITSRGGGWSRLQVLLRRTQIRVQGRRGRTPRGGGLLGRSRTRDRFDEKGCPIMGNGQGACFSSPPPHHAATRRGGGAKSRRLRSVIRHAI